MRKLLVMLLISGVVFAQPTLLFEGTNFKVYDVEGVQTIVPNAPPTFDNPQELILILKQDPMKVSKVLRQILTQEQADAFAEAIRPTPTNEEKIAKLERMYDYALSIDERAFATAIRNRINDLSE